MVNLCHHRKSVLNAAVDFMLWITGDATRRLLLMRIYRLNAAVANACVNACCVHGVCTAFSNVRI